MKFFTSETRAAVKDGLHNYTDPGFKHAAF